MATTIVIGMGVLALIFGILILIFPHILNYLVAIYLVLWGVLQFLS